MSKCSVVTIRSKPGKKIGIMFRAIEIKILQDEEKIAEISRFSNAPR